MGLLARFFKGSLRWEYMWKMPWKTREIGNNIMWYYDNYELQATEEEIIHELSYDEKGKKKNLPSMSVIRQKVDERIQQRRKKINGSV